MLTCAHVSHSTLLRVSHHLFFFLFPFLGIIRHMRARKFGLAGLDGHRGMVDADVYLLVPTWHVSLSQTVCALVGTGMCSEEPENSMPI
jgi:hypothetical protein